jgi:hypothetical protein
MKELEKKVKQLEYEFNLIKPEIEKNYNTLGLEMRLEELKALVENLSLCAVSQRSEPLQGFVDYYKKKFGNGFNLDILEITMRQYKETL